MNMEMNFFESFATFGSIAALNVFVVDFIINTFKIEKSWIKQLVSWIIPIAVSVVGFVFSLGMFQQFGDVSDWRGWVYTVLIGLGMGLSSNGIFDFSMMKSLLNTLHTLINYIITKFNKK